MSADDREIVDSVRPYTMTSPERILAVLDAVRYVVRCGIPGDLVECGVWRGGSTMAAAMMLVRLGDTSRTLYLYDTFEGMPPPTARDRSFDGVAADDQLRAAPKGTGVWCESTLDEVRSNLAITGYPAERVRYVRGKVEDTIPGTVPDRIALLRLDTDWYESTRHELTHLYPRVASKGVLIVDDYGHWEGCRRATDEYLAAAGAALLLHRIDYTGRVAVVP